VLASTNVLSSLDEWSVIGTDSFDGAGHFSFASSLISGMKERYYAVRVASTNPPPVARHHQPAGRTPPLSSATPLPFLSPPAAPRR